VPGVGLQSVASMLLTTDGTRIILSYKLIVAGEIMFGERRRDVCTTDIISCRCGLCKSSDLPARHGHTGTVYRRHRCHSTDQHLRAIIIIRSISSSSSNSDLLVAISACMLLLYCYQRCWSLALIRLTGPLLLRLRAPNQRRKRSRVQVLVVPLSGNNLGQVVGTSGPPSSIIWYWSKCGDAIRLGR